MGKETQINTSYDYIQDSLNGVDKHFQMVDFNVFATRAEKNKAETNGITPNARKMFYEQKLFPFMKSFDQEKFLKGFAKPTDRERLDFLKDVQNGKDLQYVIWLAEYSERIITDIKTVKADGSANGFTNSKRLEEEIRMQAKLYKPFLEVLKCMSDIDRYKKGELPFRKTDLTGVQKASKGKYTDEMMNIDVSTTGMDKFDALDKKNKLYERLNQEINPQPVSDKRIREYSLQATEGAKYLRLHQKIMSLDPNAGLTIDKEGFQKNQLNILCDAIKKTDPKYVWTNTREFKQMRDFLYSFNKEYDNMNPRQRRLAGKELKMLTNKYIAPRSERYELEMDRLPNSKEIMNERSRTRFELAQKLSTLCDIVTSDFVPLPEYAQPDASVKTETLHETFETKMENRLSRPSLGK